MDGPATGGGPIGPVRTRLRTIRRYLWGQLSARRSLRYSLYGGLVATTIVTGLTYLVVGLGQGIEANPVMGWVIDRYGWIAFATIRYGVVLGLFALLWPVARLDDPWPEWSEGNGRTVTAVLWVNAVRDTFVATTGIVPTFELLRAVGVW
ncbi:hypothetical protein BRD17_02055 [Halobacteriales archaeon SW_7_68_16]|nr:MAG: hypothetical protein BRD17_02055 [Halobacteriales archaeon SW_7_68_16]